MTSSAFIRWLLLSTLTTVSCGVMAADATLKQDTASSATKATEANVMSLSRAYQLALKNNAALASAIAAYKSSAEVVPQARSALLPQINASANTTYNRRTAPNAPASYGAKRKHWNTHGWSATLTQSVFDLSQWFDLSAAHAKDQLARLKLAIQEQQLIYDVADKYFAVLQAESDEQAAKANLKAVKKQLDQTKASFKVGMVAYTDVQEGKASYDAARVSVIKAANAITVAKENLSLLTNTPTPALYKLNQKMPVKGPEPNQVSAWEKQAMTKNLNVQQAKASVGVGQKQLDAAQSGHLPTISGSVSYNQSYNNSVSNVNEMGRQNNGLTASISLNVPIFSGGAVNATANAASYTLESDQKTEEQAMREAKVNARNGFNTINMDVLSVNALCQSIVSAKSSLKATQSGYEVGTRTIIDVLNSQSSLYTAQKQYLDARYSFIRNTLKLKQIAGTLSPEDLNMLNRWMSPAGSLPDSLTPYCK